MSARALLRAGVLAGVRLECHHFDPAPLVKLGAREDAPADVLVIDTARSFATGGVDGLRAALDETWTLVRDTANAAWIEPAAPGGKVVLIAPAPDAGPAAEAARAGVENMARTLSVEWARFGIRPTAILPGPGGDPDEVVALVGYLASPAGDYFSGTALALNGIALV